MLTLLFFTALILTVSGGLEARGNKTGPVIDVESQELFYDAVVAADLLPMKGPFQELYVCTVNGIGGLYTTYGPGDFGFYGGRWWVDDGNGTMDEGDHFFSYPLLGPGSETP